MPIAAGSPCAVASYLRAGRLGPLAAWMGNDKLMVFASEQQPAKYLHGTARWSEAAPFFGLDENYKSKNVSVVEGNSRHRWHCSEKLC